MGRSKKDKQATLDSIRSGGLSRGATLFKLALGSGVRYASHSIGEWVGAKGESARIAFFQAQAERLVEELGRLKGSVMKAGQMLSIYGEHFLPPEVNAVLKKLQAESRPLAWPQMQKVLQQQLGSERLRSLDIDPEPIAAASMGQVYRARCSSSGRELALKIQYPGVDKAIDSDLAALRKILALSKLVPTGASFDAVYKEIKTMLQHEADYRRELQQLEQFRGILAEDRRYILPEVFAEYSSKRVLCMSFEPGVAIDSSTVSELSQDRRNAIGLAFLELGIREVFEWRLVQTDPHFGNFRIRLGDSEQEDRIVLLDFGAVRRFPLRYISPFAKLCSAAMQQDPHACAAAGHALGFLNERDKPAAEELFAKICILAAEAFAVAEQPPFRWQDSRVIDKISPLAKDAAFTFKLRSPPPEAIFLDRKMVGMYFVLCKLGLEFSPGPRLQHYLLPYL